MIRVTHVINGLVTGGAEVALSRLLHATDRSRFAMDVIALDPRMGAVAEAIRQDGWPVRSLGMSRRGLPAALPRLASWLRESRPHVVQTWMYHSGLIAGAAARAAGSPPVVWNLRQSDLDPSLNQRTTVVAAHLSGRLSRVLPRAIVCGSQRALEFHRELGFAADKLLTIPNGIPVPRRDETARPWLREHLRLPADAVLVGRVARFHPYKDYRGLVEAAGIVARRHGAHFVFVGAGLDEQNTELGSWIAAAGLEGRVHLMGERHDVARINGGLDLACSSSLGEGFPNVIAEAMSAGVPVVATDVGDSREIVAHTGRVVAPGDPVALAAAMDEMLSLPPAQLRALGSSARDRIVTRYSLPAMGAAYSALYEGIASERSRGEGRGVKRTQGRC